MFRDEFRKNQRSNGLFWGRLCTSSIPALLNGDLQQRNTWWHFQRKHVSLKDVKHEHNRRDSNKNILASFLSKNDEIHVPVASSIISQGCDSLYFLGPIRTLFQIGQLFDLVWLDRCDNRRWPHFRWNWWTSENTGRMLSLEAVNYDESGKRAALKNVAWLRTRMNNVE